jgi:hypothetical protein
MHTDLFVSVCLSCDFFFWQTLLWNWIEINHYKCLYNTIILRFMILCVCVCVALPQAYAGWIEINWSKPTPWVQAFQSKFCTHFLFHFWVYWNALCSTLPAPPIRRGGTASLPHTPGDVVSWMKVSPSLACSAGHVSSITMCTPTAFFISSALDQDCCQVSAGCCVTMVTNWFQSDHFLWTVAHVHTCQRTKGPMHLTPQQ